MKVVRNPNGYIATGQGFGIKANAAGTATFTNSMRRSTGNNTLRSITTNEDRIWLNITNGLYEMGGSTLIGFSENTTAGIDPGYDSRRLAPIVSLYSHLQDGSEELGIQSREAFESGIIVPIGFSSQLNETLEYNIAISTLEGEHLSEATVYLTDNYTNTVHNLSDDGAYTFTSDKGTFSNRFLLEFEEEVVLGTNDNGVDAISIFPNPTDGILNILSPKESITSIEVYDVRGRKLSDAALNSQGNYTIDVSNLKTAIYFVTVTTENGSITKRIVKK